VRFLAVGDFGTVFLPVDDRCRKRKIPPERSLVDVAFRPDDRTVTRRIEQVNIDSGLANRAFDRLQVNARRGHVQIGIIGDLNGGSFPAIHHQPVFGIPGLGGNFAQEEPGDCRRDGGDEESFHDAQHTQL